MLKRVDPTSQNLEATRVDAFIDGLDPKIRLFVRAANPADLDAAIETAKNFENGFKEFGTAPLIPTQPVVTSNTTSTKDVVALLGEI